jgi:predicted AAA+ superfamily ATPase
MDRIDALDDEHLQVLLPALAEAARANQQTVDRFVPPKVGIVNETASRRHQFILGRRGVGKSSLVRMVERDSRRAESAVAFIDLETLKGIPYPDVRSNCSSSYSRCSKKG